MRQSPRLPCSRSAPRLRHLARERGAHRSQPCVASFPASRRLRWRATAAPRGHVDCWLSVGDAIRTCGNRRASRVPGRLRGCVTSHASAVPIGRSLAWPHLPRHAACARAQPARPGVTSTASRWLVTPTGTCGNRRASRVPGRLRGCVTSHASAVPVGRSLAWPHLPRHAACARAQPARPGRGSGRVGSPPIQRVRFVNGAVGADPLVRPARWGHPRQAGPLAHRGRPSWCGRPSVDDLAPASWRIRPLVRVRSSGRATSIGSYGRIS